MKNLLCWVFFFFCFVLFCFPKDQQLLEDSHRDLQSKKVERMQYSMGSTTVGEVQQDPGTQKRDTSP